MRTHDFDYRLPPERIAQEPLPERTQSRLMVVDRVRRNWEHRRVADLPGLLRSGDLLVVNDTRVIPARVYGTRADTGGRVEVLFLEPDGGDIRPPVSGSDLRNPQSAIRNPQSDWWCLCSASGRIRPGARILLAGGRVAADVIERDADGKVLLRVAVEGGVTGFLEREGLPPLPPYIRRPRERTPLTARDRERYQTVYAREPGAVAAPTAGLHFTPELLDALARRGVRRAAVTLHVGLGTFRPVEKEQAEDHAMDAERYVVSEETAAAWRETRAQGGRIVAVGTTTVRALESAARQRGGLQAVSGRTSLFILPPFTFQAVDALLTNFHLPRSTLLMLVSAFAGADLIRQAYQEAIREGYRFYSFGDCMLIV